MNGANPPKIATASAYAGVIQVDRPMVRNISAIAAGPAPENSEMHAATATCSTAIVPKPGLLEV